MTQTGPRIDTTAPIAPTILSSTLADNVATLHGAAEASASIAILDGATSLGSVTADGSGAWAFTTSGLASGSHSFTAKATDAAGNIGPASVAYALTIESVTPPGVPSAPGLPIMVGSGYDVFAPDGLVMGARYEIGQVVTIASGQGVVSRGTVVGLISASGKFAVCKKTATDGSQTPIGIVMYAVDATSADRPTIVAYAGRFRASQLAVDESWVLADVVAALSRRRSMFIDAS